LIIISFQILVAANGARDEPHPHGADAPQAQTRRSGARRSRVASEASDVGSIEQLGGRDVAHRDRPEGLQREELLDKSALTAQWNLAPRPAGASGASARRTNEYAELLPPSPLYVEMSGLCPRIDYRLQWGNDGEVLVHLLTFFRLKAPPVAQQCRFGATVPLPKPF